MSESTALLGSRPTSQHSKHSNHSNHSNASHEQTPLLSRADPSLRYDAIEDEAEEQCVATPSPAGTSLRSLQNGHSSPSAKKGERRWPTVVAIIFLGVVATMIILGVFFAPAVVEEYAKQSMVIEPTSLSIDGFTPTGVTARVQALFKLDASRVENKHVRNIGRFGTWLARKVESEESRVEVYLPEYGNILIGTATVPPIVVDIRNGYATKVDFLTNLEPGDLEGIRRVANDWLEGRLDKVRVLGKADVALKSGLIPLGSQTIAESLSFEGNEIPSIPTYNITRLNFREVPISITGRRGMAAEVSVSLLNSYPVALQIPPLSFDILVPNCGSKDPYIRLADATTGVIDIKPYEDVSVAVGGIVRELTEPLLQICPNSNSSPLDLLLGNYIHGNDTTIFVKGASSPSPDTPEWISALISSVTVPVPFPGHSFDKMIKSFTLSDAKFKLPGFFSDPDEEITISGTIVVLASLPQEMNFGINVTQVRAAADVFFKGDKLGVLDLKEWQAAQSKRVDAKDGEGASLMIQSRIEQAPLHITDEDVMNDIVMEYAMGNPIKLKIVALVDVTIETVLGELVVKDLPAEGIVPVKPISKSRGLADLVPKVGNIKVINTGKTSLNLQAHLNFTNPTEYSAEVGYFNIHILNNDSVIGDATAKNIKVGTGNNTNILVEATWDPTAFGGEKGAAVGTELLSQYISGFNTTLTFQTHEGTFLRHPKLGKALSNFTIEIPTPKLSTPSPGDEGDGGDVVNKPHFIIDATFHLLSSTAQFTLLSPLQHSTIYIEDINATAFYNHTEPVGHINYDLPFKVPPGSSQSPRLPVAWSLESVGYEAVKNALGGTLKLDAKGTVGIRLGRWSETVWYSGSGIGANIRF